LMILTSSIASALNSSITASDSLRIQHLQFSPQRHKVHKEREGPKHRDCRKR
jgi:hypothetical protein